MFPILLMLAPAVLAAPPAAGDLVFTEVLADDACGYNEWFEVYNTSSSEVDLDGCLLESINTSSGTTYEHTVVGPVLIAPNGYAVLNRATTSSCDDGNPATSVDGDGLVTAVYEYGTLRISNADPNTLRLTCDTVPQLAHMRELLKLMDRDTLELRHARERIERRDDRQPATAQPLHRTFGAGQFTMR